MNQQAILIGVIALIVALLIGVGLYLYRKKKQYNFLFKMMQQQKKQQAAQQQKEAFEAKRLMMSSQEAQAIVLGLGGLSNIATIKQCAIRLRVNLHDHQLLQQKQLKEAGVSGVIKTSQSVQLVVGDRAEQIYQEIQRILESNSCEK